MDKECPMFRTMHLLSKRWSILILLEFCKNPEIPLRYSTIKKTMPKITSKILAERLNELVKEGILSKKTEGGAVLSSYYALTKKGITLLPLMRSLRDGALTETTCPHAGTCKKCDW